MLLLCTFSLSSFTKKVIEVGIINDDTIIYQDLVMLGLTPTDYITFEPIMENIYYDETYLIAVGENRKEDSSTDVYLYLYNPMFVSDSSQIEYYLVNLSINGMDFKLFHAFTNTSFTDYDEEMELIEYSSLYNIWKFKFTYVNHVNERKYELNSIDRMIQFATVGSTFTNPFTATFKEREEDGQLVTDYEYNSFLYITKDIILTIDVTNYSLDGFGGWINGVINKYFLDGNKARLFLYNFSSSKKIDQILEIDCMYTQDRYRRICHAGGCQEYSIKDEDELIVYDKEHPRTLKNDEIEQNIYGEMVILNRFKTPSSDRIEEFGNSFEWTDELKKDFTDYEHSVLIDVGNFQEKPDSAGSTYEFDLIRDFKITRLKFETDGKIYNSYVADDPDDSPLDPNNPQTGKNWFFELLEWIQEHPLEFVLILVGLIVGIPIIVAILPYILSILGKLLVGIFKCIVWIITLPFRLIGKLINKIKERKRKKEDYKYLM